MGFILLRSARHDPFFGVAENNKMVLSEIGLTAQSLWLEIPVRFDYIQLDTFVIMPNHVHGIIVIQKPDNLNNILNRTQKCRNLPNDKIIVETGITAETRFVASLQQKNQVHPSNPNQPSLKINGGFAGNKNPMINDNLSRIMRWYKGRTAFESRKINPGFAWQIRFYDHIIRNEEEFQRIAKYIDNNPANWGVDRYYK